MFGLVWACFVLTVVDFAEQHVKAAQQIIAATAKIVKQMLITTDASTILLVVESCMSLFGKLSRPTTYSELAMACGNIAGASNKKGKTFSCCSL
jgi:hypothetical protein